MNTIAAAMYTEHRPVHFMWTNSNSENNLDYHMVSSKITYVDSSATETVINLPTWTTLVPKWFTKQPLNLSCLL